MASANIKLKAVIEGIDEARCKLEALRSDLDSIGPTWRCEYCGRANYDAALECAGCRAGKPEERRVTSHNYNTITRYGNFREDLATFDMFGPPEINRDGDICVTGVWARSWEEASRALYP